MKMQKKRIRTQYHKNYYSTHKKDYADSKRLQYWRKTYSKLSGVTINEIIDMDFSEKTLREFTESLRVASKIN